MATDKGTTATVTPEDESWEIVHEENPDRVVFEDVNDQLIGTYQGSEVITPDPDDTDNTFTQLFWRDVLVGNSAKPESFQHMDFVCTNAGFVLETAFKDIQAGTKTRVTLIKLTDVKQASPMKDFRVEIAKPRASR